jgi:hypothetical protein
LTPGTQPIIEQQLVEVQDSPDQILKYSIEEDLYFSLAEEDNPRSAEATVEELDNEDQNITKQVKCQFLTQSIKLQTH